MELYLQFGWGMMGHSRVLMEAWDGGTAILSPRDLEPEQIARLGEELPNLGANILVDPQFYMPHSEHHRLTSYDYWPESFDTATFNEGDRRQLIRGLIDLNNEANAEKLIIPGERAVEVNDHWLGTQEQFYNAAEAESDREIISTICLGPAAILDGDQISRVVEFARSLKANNYYLVLEHPEQEYLVTNPVWLANSLDLAHGLKSLGATVTVGYSNQQQLLMAIANVDAIASGTWMNVRSFPPDKFAESDDIKQRSIWYYSGQNLSEFQLPFMDIGARLGLNELLRSRPESEFSNIPFDAPRPSVSAWDEPTSFRHYLLTMATQATEAYRGNFDETLSHLHNLLNGVETNLSNLHSRGVNGRVRDFFVAIESSRTALTVFEQIYGPMLRRN